MIVSAAERADLALAKQIPNSTLSESSWRKKKTELANSKLKSLILVLTLMPNTWCSGKKGAICDDAMAKPLTPASSRYRCLPSDERKKTLTRFLARVLGGSRYKI